MSSSASGKFPPEEGWIEREDTQTRIKLHTARDEFAVEWKRRTIAIVVGTTTAITALGAIGGVISFGVGRASSTDVQAHDIRITKVEQSTSALTEKVDKNEERAERRSYDIQKRVDAVLDQVRPIAVRTGAPVVPRPPRAVMKPVVDKPMVEVTVEGKP